MTLAPPKGERALPLLAGGILALAHPPVELLLPAFIGLVPLLVFIADRPPGPAGRWSATRAGLLTGAVYFGIQLYWFFVALVFHSVLAVPAYLGIVAVLTGLTGAFAWAVHYTRERLGLPLALAATLFWPALEWTQGHLGDLAFPWLGLGAALAPFPALAGAADLVGARGLTVWIAAANGVLATLLLRYRDGRPVRATAAGLAALLLVPSAYGLVRYHTLEMRPVARVAVVQPNIPEELKLDRALALDTSLAALTALTGRLEGEPVDLVAWPEVALPVSLTATPAAMAQIRALSTRLDAPILVGAYGHDREDPGEPGTRFNSAFVIDAAGIGDDRYDKRRLVPFVERVPFIDPAWLQRLVDLGQFGALGRGTDRTPIPLDGGAAFGTLICYESIFAGLSRSYRRDGADLLVNITNDAWYGREEWWARTNALWQHPAHMVLRAIENRIGVARSANTGISMFIDPLGRTYQRTPLFEPDVRVDTVYTSDELTLFTRWGDWVGTGVAIAAVIVLVAARVRT
ncbi:MAG: apolipoprotein N-acyltransferase [Candidatus Longimicrobiales bacterium M2_2A_002]